MDLVKLIAQLCGEKAAKVNPFDTSVIFQDIGMESMEVFEMLMALEKRLDLVFDDQVLAQIVSVGDVVDLVVSLNPGGDLC
ncbi:MAG: acyl carrier protein [Erysipelotrichaceae bacterium]|jgi:acyl carrier protein|nr:acyl carrier protein [Erysipelotrichaceae bacterium]